MPYAAAMVLLIDHGDVTNRLAKIPNLQLPSGLTPDRVRTYIEEATGSILNASGYRLPPSPGTPQRQALEGLCLRLVLNTVKMDLFSTDFNMQDVLLREREAIMREAKSVTSDASPVKFMFELPGSQP